MKKTIILLAVLALPLASAGAQSGFSVFQADLGYAPAFQPGAGTVGHSWQLGLTVMVNERVGVGVSYVNIADLLGLPIAPVLFNLKYRLQDRLRAVISFTPIGPRAGLGFEYIPFSRTSGSVGTEIKFLMEYLFVTDDLTDSDFFVGIGLGLGA
jgi:hypothetical protein